MIQSIRLLIFFPENKFECHIREAVTLVNLMSFSKMEAETELP